MTDKDEHIVTVSFHNGRYEVYDHTTNTTWVRVEMRNGTSRELDSLDVCTAVEGIMRDYELRKYEERERNRVVAE